jgi:hypothetical protein
MSLCQFAQADVKWRGRGANQFRCSRKHCSMRSSRFTREVCVGMQASFCRLCGSRSRVLTLEHVPPKSSTTDRSLGIGLRRCCEPSSAVRPGWKRRMAESSCRRSMSFRPESFGNFCCATSAHSRMMTVIGGTRSAPSSVLVVALSCLERRVFPSTTIRVGPLSIRGLGACDVGGVWDVEPPSSLSSQRLNGVDASCATCGEIRSEPADEQEHKTCSTERYGI